jgi:hypothetical protein
MVDMPLSFVASSKLDLLGSILASQSQQIESRQVGGFW